MLPTCFTKSDSFIHLILISKYQINEKKSYLLRAYF